MPTFNSDGTTIAYIERPAVGADRGEPILLIHGFASNITVNWDAPLWIKTLTEAGRRVIAIDNRGHGASQKLYEPKDYATPLMAEDARRLLDHLKIERADVMGYSMGARITAFLAQRHTERVRSAILGGLGDRLIHGVGLPLGIADAMEVPNVDHLPDPAQRMFRSFAEATKSDLRAMAACIRGSRQTMSAEEAWSITCPVLVAIGARDDIAGDPNALAAMLPNAKALEIPGRDHNLAVGDRVFKRGALAFLESRP